jgi:hypothetical protein
MKPSASGQRAGKATTGPGNLKISIKTTLIGKSKKNWY